MLVFSCLVIKKNISLLIFRFRWNPKTCVELKLILTLKLILKFYEIGPWIMSYKSELHPYKILGGPNAYYAYFYNFTSW